MEDLMAYRVRIGTFCGVAAIPAVLKRSRSMLHKLKQRRQHIKEFHLKSFLWLGSILLFAWACVSLYNGPASYGKQNNVLDITSTLGEVFYAGSMNCRQDFTFSSALGYQNGISELGCLNYDQILIMNRNRNLSKGSYALPDSSLLHVHIPAIHNIFRSTLVHSSIVPICTSKFIRWELLMSPWSRACDFLLGNRGAHSYHGNPRTGDRRSEERPAAGSSSDGRNHVRELHVQMVNKLNKVVRPNSGDNNIHSEWTYLMEQFIAQEILFPAEVAEIKNMYNLFTILMRKKIINYGKYDILMRYMSMSDGLLNQCLEVIKEFEAKMTTEQEEPAFDVAASSAETKSQYIDAMAQHTASLTSSIRQNKTAHTSKRRTDVMIENVKKYEELDKSCYVTKVMKSGKEKICRENFLSITGVPGSGKTTTLWHIAIDLKKTMGFKVYPILHPTEFEKYFDRKKRQLFIWDDVIGEYSVDNDRLCAWNKYNDRIKNCLSENTKILTSLRIQLWKDQSLQGRTYIFNDISRCINLGHADFKLCKDEMTKMLRHYLLINRVHDDEYLIRHVRWLSEKFVDMFPLLCKVFSQNSAVRQHPYKFFSDPFESMTGIFTQIKTQNKHQFCGLVLCSALDLNDDYFSHLCEHELAADKIQLRNVIMESLEVETKELKRVKAELESLDGVYVTRVGNTFQFSHSLFQNIVTYLYNDSTFVFRYGTQQFITDRVRINKKVDGDNKYVLVYNSGTDIKRLADRFVQELKSNILDGAKFIVNYPCIDDAKLLSVLVPHLVKSVSRYNLNVICGVCVGVVCRYSLHNRENTDITTWHGYGLLSSLLKSGANCNTLERMRMGGLHMSVYLNCLPITKFLLQHPSTDINGTDICGRCVLHWAVGSYVMTRYLLRQPHLTCVNQPDDKNRTPLWYVVHGRQPFVGTSDECCHGDVPCKEKLKNMYKQKGGIILDVKKDKYKE